jgi:hypothetical protein
MTPVEAPMQRADGDRRRPVSRRRATRRALMTAAAGVGGALIGVAGLSRFGAPGRAIAAAPAASGPDAVVRMYRLLGGGSHAGHGAAAASGPSRLAPIAQFAPFGADAAPTGGLALASALTTELDQSNPSVGVVAASGVDRQTITLFDRYGELTTRNWGV